MVVGLSIAHGAPGSDTPSIVSATFSCDAAVYRYIHSVKLQEKGVGLITCLKQLMIDGCKVSLFTLWDSFLLDLVAKIVIYES